VSCPLFRCELRKPECEVGNTEPVAALNREGGHNNDKQANRHFVVKLLRRKAVVGTFLARLVGGSDVPWGGEGRALSLRLRPRLLDIKFRELLRRTPKQSPPRPAFSQEDYI